ncbi:hypothetical protein CONCODRAFT_9353 [Conidiobolus coronatus NRRL 28638]|uniref:MFS general substrate transporter n=1 Tax=Conidiobolus coronatus (strain ATCC 28846 / CBS 209.66 / NRRL 28638) TaxID=796925 RepID=A0A137P039_CONC2|nr:hypothetical protein CONCODRAFT_9353 [Conidiobolus coronatus NRRL 28638]|eukprot:KXN68387.1 hypothetical protein CONCODRAFT_9353 [Conidiobolus coronatus NRRL 28638]
MDNGFASPAIFIPIIIGSLMLVAFFIWELKFAKTPLLTSKLLSNRVCISIILIRAVLQFDQTLTWQYMNAYLALSRGISAYDVNLINLGYKVPWFVFGFACALAIRKISDVRTIIWISVGIYAIGVGLTIPSRSPDTYVGVVSFIEGVIGSGSGIAACATLVVLQTSVDPSEIANVSAIDTLLTNALSSVASGIAAIVWTKSLAQNLAQKLPTEYKTQIPELIADTNKLAKLPTSIRELWIDALSDSQWLICTVAISFACVCFVIALSLPPIGFQRVEDEGDEIIFDNETKEKLLASE